MSRKAVIFIMLLAVLVTVVPARAARADNNDVSADSVLLVYNDKEQMSVIYNLVQACGMEPYAVDSVDYNDEMAADYTYIVLQDSSPLGDLLEMGKQVVCLGSSFASVPGVETSTLGRSVNAELDVYNNTETVIVDAGTTYITEYSGESFGTLVLNGTEYPVAVMNDSVLYAPYFKADDLSVFAVAQMLNRYFEHQDGGKMYIMIDEVYPFNDLAMMQEIADRFYENGIPFIMSLMPVYYNTAYPSFQRYANALRYIQSKSGSFIMHAALETGNELVGDTLETRMAQAYQTFEDNGVYVFDEVMTPFSISMDALSSFKPQNELFISLPIDTVIKFNVFSSEEELDEAVGSINQKWMQIGDYRRYFTQKEFLYQEETVDPDYTYREVAERKYAFLVDAGNQMLSVIVILSALAILVLISIGFRLYHNKFLKK